MFRLFELQKQIDEATEQIHNITQNTEQPEHSYQHRDLQHEGHNHDDLRYEAFNHDDFFYDDVPLGCRIAGNALSSLEQTTTTTNVRQPF
jgi:hypothetical protein